MSNIADGLIMFTLFGVMVLGLIITVQIFSDISADTDLIPAQIRADGLRFFESIDNMGIFLVLSMVGVTIGAAFMIKTNPVFFVIAVLLLFTQFLILPIIINTINAFIMSGQLDAGVSLFPKTIWLLGLSPILSTVGGGLAAVVALRGE